MIPQNILNYGKSGSIIRDIAAYGDARRQEIGSENVFDFSIGSPSVPSPKKVNETMVRLLQTMDDVALHTYTPAVGYPCVREAAAKAESLRAGYDIPAESFYFLSGASSALAVVLKALCSEGERVALLAPFFPEYTVYAAAAGAETVIVPPIDESMQPDLEAFRAAVESGVGAVIINSPNNPSGAILSAETLHKMADILSAAEKKSGKPIYLISDEPYRELVYDGKTVPFVPNIYPNTVVCYSYSKSLSIPGERMGYIMVPPCVEDWRTVFAAVCGSARLLGYICASSLLQFTVAECAQELPDVAVYDKNRSLLYEGLTRLGFTCVRPEGAFYLFMKVPEGMSAMEFYERAKQYELLLVPSDGFGLPGYVRIAYCVAEDTIRRSLPAFAKLAEATL